MTHTAVVYELNQPYIPKNKWDKWTLEENVGFEPRGEWDLSKVILDRRHYERYYLNAPIEKRKKVISATELLNCYGSPEEERFLGGAFFRFIFEEHPDLLEERRLNWFAPAPQEEGTAHLLLLGTKYKAQGGTVHWLFLHLAPPLKHKKLGDIEMDFSSSEGYWASCNAVLRYAK